MASENLGGWGRSVRPSNRSIYAPEEHSKAHPFSSITKKGWGTTTTTSLCEWASPLQTDAFARFGEARYLPIPSGG